MDLSKIFNKYNLSFPTNITYDSYGYNKINEISLTLSKLNDKYESDINGITEKENTISKSLSKELDLQQEKQLQMNNLYQSLKKNLSECHYLNNNFWVVDNFLYQFYPYNHRFFSIRLAY